MTNAAGDIIETPDEGTYVSIVIEFKTLAMPAGANYAVRRTLDGVNYDVTLNWGAGLAGQGNWVAAWGLGYITVGDHLISAAVDAVGEISETSESDNSAQLTFSTPDTPDPMFINPLAGVPNRDWEIGNRVDMDPGGGVADYRGNPYTYNGHDAHDINLAAGWEQQDSGNFVLAAAGGTVIDTVDGNGDRSGDPNSNDAGPSNHVVIDHGGGWVTYYEHLRKNSVRVTRGDIVTTGQLIGQVGSSGNSSGPHLHWAVYHNGMAVEPYQRPTELLADPLPYEQEAPGIMDMYTTLSGVALIGRSEREVFLPSETPAIWMATQGILAGVKHDIVWYKPNGSEFLRVTRNDGSPPILVQVYFLSRELGVWKVTSEINGVKQAETKFLRSAELQPEVKVTHLATNFTEVSDGTTTPVQFDPVAPGRLGSTRTFSVRNVGNSPLTTGGLTIPAGFTLIEGLSASIEPDKVDTFTLRLDTSVAGLKSGTVSFTTNDADEAVFSFPVKGLVANLSLALSDTTISENAGNSALTGIVTRPGFDVSEAMTVYLSSSDTTEAKVPLRVTIPINATSVTFPVDAVDDTILDGSKPVRLTASLVGNVSTIADMTVKDYESLQIIFNRGSIVETAGTNAATATVSRSNLSNLEKSLTVSIMSGDTSEVTVPGTVTIPAGATSATFPLTAVNDAIADGNQITTISAAANGFVTGTAQLTVVDDETATLSLVLAAISVSENGGTTTGTVTRNTPTTSALIVNLTSSDSTAATVPSTVTIPAGAISATFPVTVVNDAIADGNQVTTISAAANGFVTGTTQLTVVDDETATLSLVLAASSISENGGTTTGTVTRNTPTTSALIVNLTSSDTTAATVPSTVTILAGATSATFTVTAVNDAIADGNQVATISVAANGLVAGTAQLTFIDDETATLSLVLAASSISENGGTTTGTVTRNTPTTSALIVNLTSSDSTAATVPSTVTIPAGATSATFRLTAVNDAIADGNQVTTISPAANGFVTGTAQLTVVDDETATLSLVLAASSISENGGTTTGTVTRNTPTASALIVNLTSSDSTAATVPSTVTIPAGAISATFAVTAVNDAIADGNQVTTISAAANGFVTGTAQLTVVDDDPPPTVTLSSNMGTIDEATGASIFTATLSTASHLPITIDLGFTGTATLTNDYTRTGTQIVIAAGQTTGSVTLTAVQDALDEVDETVIADITNVTNGTESTPQQATVIITDDDVPPTVTLSRNNGTIGEAAGMSILTATLSAASSLPVTVDLGFVGTATLISDYILTGTQIVVAPGQTSGTVTVTASQDPLDEVDETIIVNITNVSNGTEVTPQQATITIADDDTRGVSVSSVSGNTSEAGGKATFTVVLTGQPTSEVTISLSSSDTTEGIVSPAALIFTTANWSNAQTVTITGVDDSIEDGNIDFRVVTDPALGGDYDGIIVADVDVTNIDNDFPTITVSVVPSTRPTFSWNAISGFSQFEIWVTKDPNTSAFHQATVTGTSYTTPMDFGIGAYSVWVRGKNSLAITPWSAKRSFVINTAVHVQTLNATQLTSRPTIKWDALLGAVKYDFWLDNKTTGTSQYVRNQNLTGTAWTPSADLPIGTYRAWVRGVDAAGLAASWSTAVDFTVSTPVVLTPMAAMQPTSTPTISWSSITGAVKYDLWINNKTTGQTQYVRNQNLTTTSWMSATNMPIGVYRVWVRAIDSKGIAAQWSVAKEFTVATAPVITAPLNSTFNRKPTFTWNTVTGATMYQVQVRNLTTGITVYDQKNIATTNWMPPANLTDGSYRWWVVAVGVGNVQGLWTAPVDFNVGGQATLLTPTGSTTNAKPVFSWKPGDGAVRYELWVNNATTSASVIKQTNLTSLTYTPATALPQGNYRAWVRAISSSGEVGAWSLEVKFTIAAQEAAPGIDNELSPLSNELLVVTFDETISLPKQKRWASSTDKAVAEFAIAAIQAESEVMTIQELRDHQSYDNDSFDSLIDVLMANVYTSRLLDE